MNFKMSHDDFKLLLNYVQKYAPQSTLTFNTLRESYLEVSFSDKDGQDTTVVIYAENLSQFPQIVFKKRLTNGL